MSLRGELTKAAKLLNLPWQLARAKFRLKTRGRVVQGPFTGMNYIGKSFGSEYEAKLLGTYELELCDIVNELCGDAYDIVVNVGAAEGYYAVGFAMRVSDAQVIAFEISERAHPFLRKLATLNGVANRISVRGRCDLQGLTSALEAGARPLLVMDIEGEEDVMLDPRKAPILQKCAILVEVHEFVDSTLFDRLYARFFATHTVGTIRGRNRTRDDLPFSTTVLWPWFAGMMDERRTPPVTWLLLRPKDLPDTPR